MPLSETELEQMSYREVVELAKVNGVYQKKSAKKAALIRRLSTVFTNDEFSGIENMDPNRTATLTPLKEVDESLVQDSDCEGQERRKTFTKAKKATMRKASVPEVLTDPPKRQNTFTRSDASDLTNSKVEGIITEDEPNLNGTLTITEAQDVVPSPSRKVTRVLKKKSEETNPPAPIKRQNTFTKEEEEPNLNETTAITEAQDVVPSPSRKVTRVSKNKSEERNRPAPIKRQNTFTKEEESTCNGAVTNGENNYVVDSPKLQKVTRASKKSSSQEEKPMTPLTRQNTFTKDEPENVDETKSQDSGSILTTAPGKEKNDIPVLQLNTVQTPPPIEKLSVFQRLSAKIPLSERRSLVLSEKRVSVKTNFFTPQADKRSQLNALREARKNHITPRSLTRTLNGTASTMKTPVQPTIKSSATSTKKSSVKKPPNFAEIHKRHFAKMESLLEHKKRLRERAELMSPARRTQMSSSVPKRMEISTGVPKPGVKHSNIPVLLKKAATKDRLKLAMAKKCPTGVAAMHAKDKKILKGVRMNKRFQLQLALKQKKT